MNNKKYVMYFVLDAKTGVKLKYGTKKKDISVFEDPFHTEYYYLFSARFKLLFNRLVKYSFRVVNIKGRLCYVVYIYPFPKFFKYQDRVEHAGYLLGLRGKEVEDKKDILTNFVDYCNDVCNVKSTGDN